MEITNHFLECGNPMVLDMLERRDQVALAAWFLWRGDNHPTLRARLTQLSYNRAVNQ